MIDTMREALSILERVRDDIDAKRIRYDGYAYVAWGYDEDGRAMRTWLDAHIYNMPAAFRAAATDLDTCSDALWLAHDALYDHLSAPYHALHMRDYREAIEKAITAGYKAIEALHERRSWAEESPRRSR